MEVSGQCRKNHGWVSAFDDVVTPLSTKAKRLGTVARPVNTTVRLMEDAVYAGQQDIDPMG